MALLSRKEFIKATAAACGTALLLRHRGVAAVAAAGSPNSDVRVAIVGCRGKGAAHIDDFRQVKGVRVAALCDVDAEILAKHVAAFAKRGEKVAAYRDVRALLDDKSIDAVVVATPNHWHALITVWACQAGKDVYVEKPISHNVWEGRQAVAAALKYGRIVQAGTQSRSADELKQAVAFLRAGSLGKILWARGLCYKPRASIGKTSGPQPVPASIDYNLWCGPAPLTPPRRNSPQNGTVHYDWHWFWDYGGGDIANQGVHQMDICRWALGYDGLPRGVASLGGRFGYEDDAQTPNTQLAVFDYEPAPILFEVRGLPRTKGEQAMDAYRGIRVGAVIQCEGGYFAAGESGGGFIYDNTGRKMQPFIGAGGGGHPANFIDAVRSRRPSDLNAPLEGGHVSSALCHLANISHRLGREDAPEAIKEAIASQDLPKEGFSRMLDHLASNGVDLGGTRIVKGPQLAFEPGREAFASTADYDVGYWANQLLRRTYRPPFVVPEKV
jgi:predicted dehydrogenase